MRPEPTGSPRPDQSRDEKWAEPLQVPASVRPLLFLVVDTEEEFDWNAPASRNTTLVTCIREVARLQRVAGRYGVKPTYLVDYPVATDPVAAGVLGGLLDADACTIGAHLQKQRPARAER
jgi:hypothetical protein